MGLKYNNRWWSFGSILVFLIVVGCSPPDSTTSDKSDPRPPAISQEDLLDKVQQQTIQYFWSYVDPNCGMARERWPAESDPSRQVVTTGGTGFGIAALVAGVHRGFLDRNQVAYRLGVICDFLLNAETYHGAYPHWIYEQTGKTKPFGVNDDGADLVETAFLIEGLLIAQAYFDGTNSTETNLRRKIKTIWEGVEWDWFTKNGQENVLYWHWSKNKGWAMNLPIRGWNEALVVYVLAAASPTHSINSVVYTQGWAKEGGMKNGKSFYNITLPLGCDYGGPLFFEHYSFIGLNPNGLKDQYADYWEQVVNHSKINYQYCVNNPFKFAGYSDSCWGISASDDPQVGYQAHAPQNECGTDNGTITPTAALSSMPFTPKESIQAMYWFYYNSATLLGDYGFYDAFNPSQNNWVAHSFLAIDQGAIVAMIENYRSGILWDLFMSNKDVQNGLDKLGFTYTKP